MNFLKTFLLLSFFITVYCDDDNYLPESIEDSVFISYNDKGEKIQKSVNEINDEFKRKYLK